MSYAAHRGWKSYVNLDSPICFGICFILRVLIPVEVGLLLWLWHWEFFHTAPEVHTAGPPSMSRLFLWPLWGTSWPWGTFSLHTASAGCLSCSLLPSTDIWMSSHSPAFYWMDAWTEDHSFIVFLWWCLVKVTQGLPTILLLFDYLF